MEPLPSIMAWIQQNCPNRMRQRSIMLWPCLRIATLHRCWARRGCVRFHTVRRSSFHAKRIPSPPTASDAQKRRDQVKVPGGWHCLTLRCSRVQSMCRSGTANRMSGDRGLLDSYPRSRNRLPIRCADASGRTRRSTNYRPLHATR